jgi:predicted DNA-binding protein
MADKNTKGIRMKDSRITVRLTDNDRKQLEIIALKRDVPIAQVVRDAIELYIKESVKNGNSTKSRDCLD